MIDDFADNPGFTRRNGELLHPFVVRGRRSLISVISATQVYKAIRLGIGKNIMHLFVFRLRGQMEINTLFEEFSVLYDQHVLTKVYSEAVNEHHSFLYTTLMPHHKIHVCYQLFTNVLQASQPGVASP